ncbi:MAG: prepilin-type N-terminal cleavage/methylation domain-containing protein, partial [Acidobacteriota bacterium]
MSDTGVPTAHLLSRQGQRRGFTLLEIAVVLAIIALLAALTLNALDGLRAQSLYSQNAGDLLAVIRRTRNEAFARGEQTAFIV